MNQSRLYDQVAAKLAAEGLTIKSEWNEIETVLKRTVTPNRCIQAAREMRQGVAA